MSQTDFILAPDKNISCIGSPNECALACLRNLDFPCLTFKHKQDSYLCQLYRNKPDIYNASHVIWNAEDSTIFILIGKKN